MSKYSSEENNWISFSDLMTGLMVIFMFIAISYMLQVQEKQKERDLIFEEFQKTREELYQELNTEFEDDFEKWEVILDKDLSIKFTNPSVLFRSGKSRVRSTFRSILDDFLPRYFDILLQEEYSNSIAEIRIEGHTDQIPTEGSKIPYIGNLELSQDRARAVMKFFVKSDYYKALEEEQSDWLLYKLTANGLSYGKTLDSNNDYSFISKEKINEKKSRRVEFRIITSSDQLIQRVLDQMEN